MDSYNNGRSIGMVVGVIVGLVLAVILIRYMNKDHRMRTEYDEMQKQIRNQGYKYAFYTVIILEALLCLVSGFIKIPAEPIVIYFAPIALGITVQASYSIWKGAYVGLNTNIRRYFLVAIIATAINLLAVIMAWSSGSLLVGGVLQAPAVNLLCALMFAVLGVVALLHKAADREAEE